MGKYARSPLAPKTTAQMPPIPGTTPKVAQAHIRYAGRDDLLLVEFAQGTTVAGVFTRSKTPSAAVDWCRSILSKGTARALLVNSGNANAFTGKRGVAAVEKSADAVSGKLSCGSDQVFLASTGVIGEPLPVDKIEGGLLLLQPCGWDRAATAIMTTDTFPKMATRRVQLSTGYVSINGIAKGSGMIAPDMATLLAFFVTDAKVPVAMLQSALNASNSRSFNSITVDSDTSTSDTVLLFATGQGAEVTQKDLGTFAFALDDLMIELAQQVVRDGEGAKKFITVRVHGAESDAAAKRIGFAIGNSPLVKTAIAGEDANWGRIVAAVGKSGEKVERDRLSISIGGITIAKLGERVEHYAEAPVAAHMKGQEILIEVDIGVGAGKGTIWTCDLTHTYIDINADYRS